MAGGESLLRKHATAALPVGPRLEIRREEGDSGPSGAQHKLYLSPSSAQLSTWPVERSGRLGKRRRGGLWQVPIRRERAKRTRNLRRRAYHRRKCLKLTRSAPGRQPEAATGGMPHTAARIGPSY
jgi:hypothetical protein